MLQEGNIDFGPKPIKVFDEWIKHKDAHSIVEKAWSMEVKGWRHDVIFREKLKNVKMELKKWFSTSQCKLKGEIEEPTKKVVDWELKAEVSNLNDNDILAWKMDRDKLLQKEKNETEMLKQKARYKWDLESDENSKFFHSCIRKRQHKNNIQGVNANGVWTTDPAVIKNEAHKHFANLFSGNKNDGLQLENWDGPRIEKVLADKLEEEFSERETLEAIKSCGKNKSPGPDGFNLLFYINFWDIFKVDLMKAITWF
ncbi:uncharacterized protein [Rutidosis leptorrhynchoides]|uniref:uncharacterized protein n=1 Tax=Rutidosis leptorrhynchoides TaxID=125765 RepID=UPI003A99D1E3